MTRRFLLLALMAAIAAAQGCAALDGLAWYGYEVIDAIDGEEPAP